MGYDGKDLEENAVSLDLNYPRREAPSTTPMQKLVALVYRQKFTLLIAFLIVFLLGAVLTLTSPRRYEATASVQFDQQPPRVISLPDLEPEPSVQDAETFLQTQLDRVRSRQIADRVSKRLKISETPRYLEALDIDKTEPGQLENRIFLALQDGLLAQIGLNTRIATIKFSSRDPVVSAQVANGFARELIEASLLDKEETSTKAMGYLEEQLAEAKSKLEDSERQSLLYARNANLTQTIAPGLGMENGSLRSRQLGSLTDSLSDATARRIEAQQVWLQARNTAAMAVPEVLQNRAIQDLLAQKSQVQAALAEERQRHTEEYPTVREMTEQVREIDGMIGSVSENIRRSYFARYSAAARQEQQLNATVAGLQSSAMAEQERGVEYNSLKREAETNKVFYDGLLQRYKEIAAASGAPPVNVFMIDRAQASLRPTSPNVPRNLALALIGGFLAASGAALFREKMHNVVRTQEDLEESTGMPSLGFVPKVSGAGNVLRLLADPSSQQAEAYNSLAVSLEQLNGGGLPKSVLITSSTASEGKSTTAIGLARSLTTLGHSVILVDGDLRNPSLLDIIGTVPPVGLADLLEGRAKASDVIFQPSGEDFRAVSAGKLTATPVSALAQKHSIPVFHQLSKLADIVLIDGPPILGLADAVLLSRAAEVTLMIVEANWIDKSHLASAVERLSDRAKIGGILTKFDPRAAGLRYGHDNYYAR